MKSKILSTFLLLALLVSTPIEAAETDVYGFSWLDTDKEVFVLQNRKFRKAGRLHANLGGGITTSGAYVDSMAIQGRVGYFLTEEYGVEFLYSKNSGKENDTYKAITTAATSAIPFRRIVSDYMGAMFLWSPFYSKINTFNSIIYADYIFGIGLAKLNEKNNKSSIDLGVVTDDESESHSGFMWQAGMKIHLNENWSVRPDLTVIHYQAVGASGEGTKKINSNYDATISIGYTF